MNPIRPQTVTLAAVAVIVGLVTAWAAKVILTQKPVVPVVEQPKMARVVVAQANLTEYMRITDRDVANVDVPPAEVPAGALPVMQRAVGRLIKQTVVAGRIVREEDLFPPGTVPKIADQLPPGYRAVVVPVADAIASNGAIQPGSFVDISLTFDSDHPDVQGTATEILLHHMKVLTPNPASMGNQDPLLQSMDRGRSYIVVAATPEQANRLILAQKYGTLNVTLCSSQETDAGLLAEGGRDLINKFDLLGLAPIPPVLEPVVEPPIRKVVEVYRGTSIQRVVFNEEGDLLGTEVAMTGGAGAAPAGGQAGVAGQKSKTGASAKSCATCGGKKKVNFGPPQSATQNSAVAPTAGGGAPTSNTTSRPTPAVRPQPIPEESTPAPPTTDDH